ncbi:HAD family hydrolase [Vibrio splendidus]
MNRQINHHLYDFDGTLTKKNTLTVLIDALIAHTSSINHFQFYNRVIMKVLPKLGKDVIKHGLFSMCGKKTRHRHKGIIRRSVLSEIYDSFSVDDLSLITRKDIQSCGINDSVLQTLMKAANDGHPVAIVTASPEDWVSKFVVLMGWPVCAVYGTRWGVSDKECIGSAKRERLIEENKGDPYVYRTGYGNLPDDFALLHFCDDATVVDEDGEMFNFRRTTN